MDSDLWAELRETERLLGLALQETGRRGDEMVAAKARYYSLKAKAVFELRERGLPATLITQVVKGLDDVNEAMSEFNRREVEYENAREARLCYKKRIDVLREQLQREWSAAGAM